MKNLDIIVKMVFGSHLYGTNTPDSDSDFKIVSMPTKEQILLGKVPQKSKHFDTKEGVGKNTNKDVDIEVFTLHNFIELACQGQTVALDMLHAPKEMVLESSHVWDEIVANRERFYTKNLKAFVGYARRQCAKYSCRGSRLNSAQSVIDVFKYEDDDKRLSELWDELPTDEHLHMLGKNSTGIRQYQVCGKILQESICVGHAREIVQRFLSAYGQRAILAAENKGIDFKAVSHAIRAAYEVKELLTDNTITFPLKEAEFLKKVKRGELDYLTEVSPVLDELMSEVEGLSEKSTLPESADREFWERFIMEKVEEAHFVY